MSEPSLTPAEAVRCKFPRRAAMFSDYFVFELGYKGNTKFAVRVEQIDLRFTLAHPKTGRESEACVQHTPGTIAIRASLKTPLVVSVDGWWIDAVLSGDEDIKGNRGLVGYVQVVRLVIGKPFPPGTVVELADTARWPKVPMRFWSVDRFGHSFR